MQLKLEQLVGTLESFSDTQQQLTEKLCDALTNSHESLWCLKNIRETGTCWMAAIHYELKQCGRTSSQGTLCWETKGQAKAWLAVHQVG